MLVPLPPWMSDFCNRGLLYQGKRIVVHRLRPTSNRSGTVLDSKYQHGCGGNSRGSAIDENGPALTMAVRKGVDARTLYILPGRVRHDHIVL